MGFVGEWLVNIGEDHVRQTSFKRALRDDWGRRKYPEYGWNCAAQDVARTSREDLRSIGLGRVLKVAVAAGAVLGLGVYGIYHNSAEAVFMGEPGPVGLSDPSDRRAAELVDMAQAIQAEFAAVETV